MHRFLKVSAAVFALAVMACADTPTAPAEPQADVSLQTSADKPPFSDAAKRGSSSIVELAMGTGALSTLVDAIVYSDANCATGFAALLGSSAVQYTVFAPTNDAFAALIEAVGAETVLSCDVLPTVLAFHATSGRHHSRSVLAHKRFRMLSGEYAAVEGTTIAGAALNLDLIDISASNGIVHVVDDVLLPGSILAALGN